MISIVELITVIIALLLVILGLHKVKEDNDGDCEDNVEREVCYTSLIVCYLVLYVCGITDNKEREVCY